jgi:hypothetical protein
LQVFNPLYTFPQPITKLRTKSAYPPFRILQIIYTWFTAKPQNAPHHRTDVPYLAPQNKDVAVFSFTETPTGKGYPTMPDKA